MNAITPQLSSGLRIPRQDPRTFKFHTVFGAVPRAKLPEEDFQVCDPIFIEQQDQSDICVAEMASTLAEGFHGIDFEPAWTFAMIKMIEGNWENWGSDPLDGFNSGVKFGFLPKSKSPYSLKDGRDFIANPDNWPNELLKIASAYRMGSFYDITGPYDLFDNIRSALWINYQAGKKSAVGTGCYFVPDWINAQGGIVADARVVADPRQTVPHALVFNGQKMISGVPYAQAQLSSGKEVGNGGLFYFSRETVNTAFLFAKCYRELSKNQAQFLNRNNLSVDWLWLAKIIGKLFN